MSLNDAGEFDAAPAFWIPLPARPRPSGPAKGGISLYTTLALLRPGVTTEEATVEAQTLMPARVGEMYPIAVVNARVEQARSVRPVLLLFQIGVLFVLLIACVNVVNLLTARGVSHRKDLAVRWALGAGPIHLARYSIGEGLIIGLLGGVGGALLTYVIVALFRSQPPFVLPRLSDVRVDGTVLGFACMTSVIAGALVGSAEAVRTARRDLAPELVRKATFRSRNRGGLQGVTRLLIVAEAASATVLLAGAGLLLSSFVRLATVDRGFEPDGVFTFRVSLPAHYEEPSEQYAFHAALSTALRGLPHVTGVAASPEMLGRAGVGFDLSIDGRRFRNPIAYQVLTPGFLKTLRVPLRGREFAAVDRAPQARVAVVNEAFLRRFLPGSNAIGQVIQFQGWSGLEIVGVAGDTRISPLDARRLPAVYLPEELDRGFASATYVLRTSNFTGLLNGIRTAAARVDTNAVIFEAATMNDQLEREIVTPRLIGGIALGLAVVAVSLAAIGLYGVVSYLVGTRTREFGIRVALGAERHTLILQAMRGVFARALLGIAIGILLALYVSRFLETLLFGVRPRDPMTLLLIAVGFLSLALIACYIPSRRAARIDPSVALRAE